jgi:hypothetical protein
LRILLIFSYPVVVAFNIPSSLRCDYIVTCKGCGENTPAPIQTVPDTWIVATCPLCRERRRYLPAEIFQGMLSYKLRTKQMGTGR